VREIVRLRQAREGFEKLAQDTAVRMTEWIFCWTLVDFRADIGRLQPTSLSMAPCNAQ
jgi:hypothetical protein